MVSAKSVLPVEIHAINEGTSSWLTDKHVKEIIELVQGAVVSYLESGVGKKQSSKQQNKPADIITGHTVRLGYVFKSRHCNQTCLIDMKNVRTSRDLDHGPELRNFSIMKEKLVVYAQPLIAGAPAGTSQLVRLMNERRESSGGVGVSISNYFQKIPSQSSAQSTETSRAPVEHESQSTVEDTETACLPAAPPSEGRRSKIKNILKRTHIGKSRLKRSTVAGKCVPKNENIDPESSCHSTSEHSVVKDENKLLVTNKSDIKIEKENKVSYTIAGVKVRPVSIPDIDIDSNSGDTQSLTVISVEAAKEMQQKNETQSSENDPWENQSESHGNSADESSSSDDMMDLPSVSFCLKPGNEKRGKRVLSQKQNGDYGPVAANESPKFGTKRKHLLKEDNKDIIEEREYIDGQLEPAGKNRKERLDACKSLQKFRFKKRKLPKFSDSDSDSSVPERKAVRVDRLSTIDSESEEGALSDNKKSATIQEEAKYSGKPSNPTKVIEEAKTSTSYMTAEKSLKSNVFRNKSDFVNLEQMKVSRGKMNISKSFFTDDGSKVQPKLSFFMNKGKENKQKSEDDDVDAADLDCELIMELCATPRIKNERDAAVNKEIEEISNVEDLNQEQLEHMVRHREGYLRKIFEGSVLCERHLDFKRGGSSKRDLDYNSRIGSYTDEQVDTVMEALINIFCKRHNKYLDYLMKVLLPEMLVKIYMDIHNTSHEASEQILAHDCNPKLYKTHQP
ncbi:uncharacterized protein LOC128208055 isoform X2 [Mya arenaria]|uniref:uncharacterized protein LOC128208055 isoform X2 n=1 Tax=Mya arenaria TaxID=6604 RepID=UPI0022E71308|nr:uncharacterized protein LOC128208055 isoform X2 [Mya arenaria]